VTSDVWHYLVQDLNLHVFGLLSESLFLLVHLGQLLLNSALGFFIVKPIIEVLIQSASLLGNSFLLDRLTFHHTDKALKSI
jgi:hypothetical protein